MVKSLMKEQNEWKDIFIASGLILPEQENVKSTSYGPYDMDHLSIICKGLFYDMTCYLK